LNCYANIYLGWRIIRIFLTQPAGRLWKTGLEWLRYPLSVMSGLLTRVAMLVQSGRDFEPIITHRFAFDDFQRGFTLQPPTHPARSF
jgi:hypothetical protein